MVKISLFWQIFGFLPPLRNEFCPIDTPHKKNSGAATVYVTIADADIGSRKSFHALFGKYLNHMLVKFEQNRIMVRTIQNVVLFDKKWLTIFDKVFTTF